MTSKTRPASDPERDLREALKIVGKCASSGDKQSSEIPGLGRFGELFLFTKDERNQLEALSGLIQQYVARAAPSRPLSLAVFGPPGSGKSFTVKQILKEVEKTLNHKLPRTDVNLTQVFDSAALGKVLTRAGRLTDRSVPVVFFDEFDAPRGGAPFGWLAWFLAPMQDGEFVHDGEVISLRRAVYVFAGGTAATMQEFSDFDRLPEFQRAKGPDFVSRLRGFLDVCGPNGERRLLRRAVLFRGELRRALGKGAGRFQLDREVMKSLLQVGRYRHGARSIAAVVELSNVNESTVRFGWEELPQDHLLALHIDRGPLDSRSIGGAIALSGYSQDSRIAVWWLTVARKLGEEGATLSYAGASRGSLMRSLVEDLKKRPPEPSADPHHRHRPHPWLLNFVDTTTHGKVPANFDRIGLHVTIGSYLTDEERTRLDQWLAQVLERFRRRLAASDASVARFVVAGATAGHRGRFPGIAEEVMLTLAQGKPVYIAGGLGGAAADVGSLLGLAHPRRGAVPPSLQAEPRESEQSLLTIIDELRPGPWTDLPVTAAELASFLKAHALGGRKWPDNGLTEDENRKLFGSKDTKEVAALVVNGLLRRYAKTVSFNIDATRGVSRADVDA